MGYKKYIFAIALFVVLISGRAQNLVPNPSFEDTISCPTAIGQVNKTKFWVNPTQATPDYFNACSTANFDWVHVPDNGFGFQNAHTGNAYAGFYTFDKSSPNNYIEYIQVDFASTLLVSHKYLVSFYVSLSEVSQYAVSSIGALFTATPITSNTTTVMLNSPQIQNPAGNYLTDKANWMLIQDTLTSVGNEQYLTIGNFKLSNQSDTLYLGNIGGANVAYYYVDDISVIDVQNLGIDNVSIAELLKVFPSPASNVLNIELKNQHAEVKLLDVLGNELITKSIFGKEQLDISSLPKGVYILQIKSGQYTAVRKFITE